MTAADGGYHPQDIADAPSLPRRASLLEMSREAQRLEARALSLRSIVNRELGRQLDEADSGWSIYEIAAARRGESAGVATQIVRGMRDPAMRSALRNLDGEQLASEALLCFERCAVIRRYDLLSSASEQEKAATLHRLFDWWIIAARPACERLNDRERGVPGL